MIDPFDTIEEREFQEELRQREARLRELLPTDEIEEPIEQEEERDDG